MWGWSNISRAVTSLPQGLPFPCVVGLGSLGLFWSLLCASSPSCLSAHLPAAELSLPLPGLYLAFQQLLQSLLQKIFLYSLEDREQNRALPG